MEKRNITGEKFGRLTPLEAVGKNKRDASLWRCLCDCNTERILTLSCLISGNTRSCGCLHQELRIVHNLIKHPLYKTWDNMMRRCYDLKCTSYPDYGGRIIPITVCPQWHDIKNFVRDVEPLRIPGLTMHRKDNNKNYEPGNIEYATWEIQNNNRRNTVFQTFNGKTQTLSQWSREIGVEYSALWHRIFTSKWPLEKALTT